MLIFKLYGGNVSVGRPGDEANMYTYFGPRGIKVWCTRVWYRDVQSKSRGRVGKGASAWTVGCG